MTARGEIDDGLLVDGELDGPTILSRAPEAGWMAPARSFSHSDLGFSILRGQTRSSNGGDLMPSAWCWVGRARASKRVLDIRKIEVQAFACTAQRLGGYESRPRLPGQSSSR